MGSFFSFLGEMVRRWPFRVFSVLDLELAGFQYLFPLLLVDRGVFSLLFGSRNADWIHRRSFSCAAF